MINISSLNCKVSAVTAILLVEKDVALGLNKLEFPLPKNDLCQVWKSCS